MTSVTVGGGRGWTVLVALGGRLGRKGGGKLLSSDLLSMISLQPTPQSPQITRTRRDVPVAVGCAERGPGGGPVALADVDKIVAARGLSRRCSAASAGDLRSAVAVEQRAERIEQLVARRDSVVALEERSLDWDGRWRGSWRGGRVAGTGRKRSRAAERGEQPFD